MLHTFILLLAAVATGGAPLVVEITGVRSGSGRIRVDVCEQENFLKDPCPQSGATAARAGRVTVTLPQVRSGRYAVQVYHDENGDGRLARGFMGIPKEGFGFSNNIRPRFGPPRFNDAAVTLGGAPQTVSIALSYP